MNGAQASPRVATNRPAGVPEGFVITPFGYFHPSCVNQLAQGDVLQQDQQSIKHADGSVDKIQPCAFARYGADGEEMSENERADENPTASGWLASASVTTTTAYGYLYGFWNVPLAPTKDDGQYLFFFNGLEDSNNPETTILQPVLGWNTDYSNAWGIASWNCCVKGNANEAPPAPVSSGDLIFGYTLNTCAVGTETCSYWNVVTSDLTNKKISQFSTDTSGYGQTFNWAFGGVLEVGNIVQCGDYPNGPAEGSRGGGPAIHFYNQGLFDYNLVRIASPAWKVSTQSGLTPSCENGASTPEEITITY